MSAQVRSRRMKKTVSKKSPVLPPNTDTRSPLAKARDKWLSSAEGIRCTDPSILRYREHGVYLINRLRLAFLAGANWMERQKKKRGN